MLGTSKGGPGQKTQHTKAKTSHKLAAESQGVKV